MTQFANASASTKAIMIGVGLAACAFIASVVWIVVALAGLGVLTPNLDLIDSARWLIHYRNIEAVAKWNAIGAACGGALILLFILIALLRRTSNQHGAARWATEAEIRAEGLRGEKGIVLGRANNRYLVFGGTEHVMLYAPTRAGKGVSAVIPNLLNWPDSVVVLDIKRENYRVTAGYRAENGQRVLLFDPLANEGETARYNPLGYINRASPDEVLDELQKIATMLFSTEGKKDPFWEEGARTGFIGVGAMVAATPSLPFTMGEIYRQLTQGDPRTRLSKLVEERKLNGPPLSSGCITALGDFVSNSDNTFGGLKQTITSRLGLWVNPRVDHSTSASDFDLRTLKKERTSLYLCASFDNMPRVAPLYNLLFQQLVDLNTRHEPDPKTEPYQILFLLDEFARLGTANVIAQGFSYVAGYGLRFMPVLQSPSQLRTAYGPDVAEEIMTNCGVEIIFTPKELKIAQELSERMGFYDFKAKSRSRPAMLGGGKHTVTDSAQKRALMLPQELLKMSKQDLILVRGGIDPIKGRKIIYYKNKDFTSRLRPAPAPRSLKRTPKRPSELETLQQQMNQMAQQLSEIHKLVVIERPMTVEEAAGETPISGEMLDAALEDLGLMLPDLPELTEEEAEAFMAEFIDASCDPTPAPELV